VGASTVGGLLAASAPRRGRAFNGSAQRPVVPPHLGREAAGSLTRCLGRLLAGFLHPPRSGAL